MNLLKAKEFKLHKRIKQFEIEGLDMIENLCNGSIIGLDDKGRNLVNLINDTGLIRTELLDSEEQHLLDCMIESKFFTEEETSLKAAYVHLTDNCNLHCIGCYSYVENRNLKQENGLALESIYYILDQLKSSGVEQIIFSGGEPFIR
jgi:sulfatase maturation enzyme AslB (radical SAM superfamily)